MNNEQLRIIYVFTDLILPLICGYFFHKKHILSDHTNTILIKFNIIVILMLLAIFSFWTLPLTLNMLWLPMFGILYTIVPGLIAAFTFGKRFTNYLDRGAYIITCMLSNIGTLGGLCAFILYGEPGFAYVQLVATPQNILLVVLAFPIAQYFKDKQKAAEAKTKLRLSIREMFFTVNQLPFVGMLIGISLHQSGINRPDCISNFFPYLVHISSWISLLPVGFLINFADAGKCYRQILSMLPIRFIIVPLIFFTLAKSLYAEQTIIAVLLLIALTPSAINAVLTARLYQLNISITTAAFIMTTTIFIVGVFPLLFLYIKTGGQL